MYRKLGIRYLNTWCDVLSVPIISHYTSERAVNIFSTDDLTLHVWKTYGVLSVPVISYYTSATRVVNVVSIHDLILHVCKTCDVLSVPMILYDTEDDVRNDNRSLRLSILTAVVLDVGPRWIQSRRLHTAARKQTAVVVVNKGRSRTGQAVHHRLIQQNVVAKTGVTQSTRALLVRRDRPRAGWSVMRRTILTIIKVWTFCWRCCASCCIVLLTLCSHYFTSPPWPQQNCPSWDN